MKPRALAAVAAAVGGEAEAGGDVAIRSVETDSRLVHAGALFVALAGERRDGHAFVADALAQGAAAAMVRTGFAVDAPTVRVADTGQALLDLAADERRGFGGTVVAITGANGKTSTKDMTATVCAQRHRTHASPSSFNNEVGVPMTLLGAPPDAEVIVAELGARHVGDVASLMPIADPSVVVVTNVGVAHIEVFGSWDAIVEASAEPIDVLRADAVAILNVDDPVVASYAARTSARVTTFGRGNGAAVRAEAVTLGRDGCASFDLVAANGRERVTLAVPGEHMIANALAAAAVGLELAVALPACAAALSAATITPWRMQVTVTRSGVRIVNDAYNANPESMAAALRTTRWMAGDGRLIAVLGQMAELGPIAADEHERIGELAARLHVDRLITIGPEAKAIAAAGVREGVEPDNVADYDDADAAAADVLAVVRDGDVVLVKGSRVTGLERLAARLVEDLS
ncbi:MAG: UDP-N-acetylmuramoyl-tripeptide--D-alanyl-D-alanine ligase [Actinomycetota bacterium]